MKKLITILMAAVLLLSSVLMVSCANGPDEKQNDLSDRVWKDNLPDDLDFGGETVMFVFAEGGDTFTARSIMVEEDSADDVDKLIYKRNTDIETRLNVKIDSLQASTSITGLRAAINNALVAGNGEYDVIAGYQYYDIGLATEGWLIDLNKIGQEGSEYSDATNYIDINAEYWATNYINSISYGGSNYWVTGDLALRYLGGMYCTFVNAAIYADTLYNTYGDIYRIAEDGKWTIELLNEMASKAYMDRGAEGTDEEDRLGYAWESNDPIDGLAFGSNVRFSTTYSNGAIDITVASQHTIDFVEQLEKLLTSSYSLQVEDRDSATVMEAFASGNLAFTVNKIFQAEARLRDMSDDYYIIPAPKLNEEQENYVTGIHDGITLFAVPWDAPYIDKSTATLEALCAESNRSVIPTYYESALKFKYTRDNDASKMVDIMRETANTDFAAAWSAEINELVHIFRTNYRAGVMNSTLRAIATSSRSKLETLLNKLSSAEE